MQKITRAFNDTACAFCFATDDNYFKYFAVALQSLMENASPCVNYDIVVLGSNTNAQGKLELAKTCPPNFSVRYVDVAGLLKQAFDISRLTDLTRSHRAKWTLETFYRLFIPILMTDYARVIYCDVDVVFNSNIDELMSLDLGDDEVAVCLESVTFFRETYGKDIFSALKLKNPEAYFNAGIMIFNCSKINGADFLSKAKEILRSKIELKCADQDVLNLIYDKGGKWFLPLKYNLQAGTLSLSPEDQAKLPVSFWDAVENPAIIHYTGALKPWKYPRIPFADTWWRYAKNSMCYNEIRRLFRNADRYARLKKMVECVFSVRNSPDKTSKIVKFLGMKIVVRKKMRVQVYLPGLKLLSVNKKRWKEWRLRRTQEGDDNERR